jgi:uncharacterized protein (DUF433 family)/DNA-binding transcriptional MerR regulator
MGTPILVSANERDPWLRRLTLPAYQVKDAARYAGVTTQTVLNWQKEGNQVGSAIAHRKPREALSWLKLQELAIVAAWRALKIPLQDIRRARDWLRNYLNNEFPFADERVVTDGQDIIMLLDEVDKRAFKILVANKGGQEAWPEIIGRRFAEFDYANSRAVRWRIFGDESGVVLDPRIAFGAPTVKGVPTWALKGRFNAGEVIEDIAADFVLEPEDVKKALAFEGITVH